MEKKKSSKALIIEPSDNQLRIKRLLQDLEREFDILLNENQNRKLKINNLFQLKSIIYCDAYDMLMIAYTFSSPRAVESLRERKWDTSQQRKRTTFNNHSRFRNIWRKKKSTLEVKANSERHKSRLQNQSSNKSNRFELQDTVNCLDTCVGLRGTAFGWCLGSDGIVESGAYRNGKCRSQRMHLEHRHRTMSIEVWGPWRLSEFHQISPVEGSAVDGIRWHHSSHMAGSSELGKCRCIVTSWSLFRGGAGWWLGRPTRRRRERKNWNAENAAAGIRQRTFFGGRRGRLDSVSKRLANSNHHSFVGSLGDLVGRRNQSIDSNTHGTWQWAHTLFGSSDTSSRCYQLARLNVPIVGLPFWDPRSECLSRTFRVGNVNDLHERRQNNFRLGWQVCKDLGAAKHASTAHDNPHRFAGQSTRRVTVGHHRNSPRQSLDQTLRFERAANSASPANLSNGTS